MDVLEGAVINVLDGDTFDLDVDKLGTNSAYEYNDVERVRLHGVDAPELNTSAGRAAHAQLRSQIAGQRVRIQIHARDKWGRLVADIVSIGRSVA